jgi:phenylpropionate dioxygenase-like ring-hydroxylating dioxygenase large terminal subunit
VTIRESLEVRERLESGATLPAEWYVDADVFRLERERIFEHTWQCVGIAEGLQSPGDYLTATVAEVPVVVVRNKAKGLRGFVNVCRHRCSEVVLEPHGHRNVLQCHYHAWTYDLDGQLISAPRSDREPDFDLADYCLVPVQVGALGPYVFVNLDLDAPPLAHYLADLPERMRVDGLELDGLVYNGHWEQEVAANWKVVVENFDECYHCPVAHPGFSKVMEVDPEGYRLEWGTWTSRAVTPLRTYPGGPDGHYPYDVSGPVKVGQFAYLWPTFTINQSPGPRAVTAFYMVPLAPERTLLVTESHIDPTTPDAVVKDRTDFTREVFNEDVVLVESVQRGLRSGRVRHGRLLLDSERLIQHFQLLVSSALDSSADRGC